MARSLGKSLYRRPAACRCNSRLHKDDRGFSLVEVLISMVIMMVGLVAVAQLLAVSVHTHSLGRRTSEASILATAKLEDLAKLNHATAAAVQITGVDSLTANVANYFDQPAGPDGHTRRWQVSAGPAAGTRRVTVRVVPPANRVPWLKPVDVTTILRQW
ncbi:MAG: prepilin-type N-terminal cleavage/methylation domain-containing protein [Vicinamibacterales bacterium]